MRKKPKLESCCHKPKQHQGLPATSISQEQRKILLQRLKKEHGLLTSRFQTSSLHNCQTIHFCCFKPHFVVQSLSCTQLFFDPMDCSPPGFSVHGIFQTKTLEWVSISFSRQSSKPKNQSCVSCIGRQILYGNLLQQPLETNTDDQFTGFNIQMEKKLNN